jgi:hypothetical protein
MRTFLIVGIALQFVVSAALAQPTVSSAAPKSDLLSMDQKVKVGEIITEKTPPLTSMQFSPVVDAVVPSQVQIQDLPSDAKKLAPQRRTWHAVFDDKRQGQVAYGFMP